MKIKLTKTDQQQVIAHAHAISDPKLQVVISSLQKATVCGNGARFSQWMVWNQFGQYLQFSRAIETEPLLN